MIHKFNKEAGAWYIDIPGFIEQGLGSKGNLMMVAGADTLLDILSNNGDEVTIEFDENDFEGSEDVLLYTGRGMNEEELKIVNHPEVDYGGYYISKNRQHPLWLCPVAEMLFGGHYPEKIFIKTL